MVLTRDTPWCIIHSIEVTNNRLLITMFVFDEQTFQFIRGENTMNTELNITALTSEQKSVLFSQLLDDKDFYKELEDKKEERQAKQKTEIERQIKELEEEVKGEREKQEQSKVRQREIEAEINRLNGQISSRKYLQFVNPKNPNEIYTTGQYKPWMKELAAENGINIHDKTAMKKWVNENSR